MKVAITGGLGFVGKYVVAEFERHSVSPVLICRPKAKIPSALAGHNVVFCDFKSAPKRVFDLMGQPDILIHLAWGGLPNYKSLHHFEEELPTHYRFLKTSLESGLSNLLVSGTCLEYGMQSGSLREDVEPRPNTSYGFAKDSLRRQLEYLKGVMPFSFTWARIFYVYGPGQSENSLFSQLERAVRRGDSVFNMSGGEQLRDFLSISEAARCIVSLALTGRDNGVVNICSGKPTSVRRLVEDWINKNGWSIDLHLGQYPYPDYEPMAFWGNQDKLTRCLER